MSKGYSSMGEALVELVIADDSILPCPVPIFDSTGDSLPPIIISDLSQVYSRRLRPAGPC